MDTGDDFYYRESQLKILIFNGRTEYRNRLFASREINREYHTLFQDFLSDPKKFYEFFTI